MNKVFKQMVITFILTLFAMPFGSVAQNLENGEDSFEKDIVDRSTIAFNIYEQLVARGLWMQEDSYQFFFGHRAEDLIPLSQADFNRTILEKAKTKRQEARRSISKILKSISLAEQLLLELKLKKHRDQSLKIKVVRENADGSKTYSINIGEQTWIDVDVPWQDPKEKPRAKSEILSDAVASLERDLAQKNDFVKKLDWSLEFFEKADFRRSFDVLNHGNIVRPFIEKARYEQYSVATRALKKLSHESFGALQFMVGQVVVQVYLANSSDAETQWAIYSQLTSVEGWASLCVFSMAAQVTREQLMSFKRVGPRGTHFSRWNKAARLAGLQGVIDKLKKWTLEYQSEYEGRLQELHKKIDTIAANSKSKTNDLWKAEDEARKLKNEYQSRMKNGSKRGMIIGSLVSQSFDKSLNGEHALNAAKFLKEWGHHEKEKYKREAELVYLAAKISVEKDANKLKELKEKFTASGRSLGEETKASLKYSAKSSIDGLLILSDFAGNILNIKENYSHMLELFATSAIVHFAEETLLKEIIPAGGRAVVRRLINSNAYAKYGRKVVLNYAFYLATIKNEMASKLGKTSFAAFMERQSFKFFVQKSLEFMTGVKGAIVFLLADHLLKENLYSIVPEVWDYSQMENPWVAIDGALYRYQNSADPETQKKRYALSKVLLNETGFRWSDYRKTRIQRKLTEAIAETEANSLDLEKRQDRMPLYMDWLNSGGNSCFEEGPATPRELSYTFAPKGNPCFQSILSESFKALANKGEDPENVVAFGKEAEPYVRIYRKHLAILNSALEKQKLPSTTNLDRINLVKAKLSMQNQFDAEYNMSQQSLTRHIDLATGVWLKNKPGRVQWLGSLIANKTAIHNVINEMPVNMLDTYEYEFAVAKHYFTKKLRYKIGPETDVLRKIVEVVEKQNRLVEYEGSNVIYPTAFRKSIESLYFPEDQIMIGKDPEGRLQFDWYKATINLWLTYFANLAAYAEGIKQELSIYRASDIIIATPPPPPEENSLVAPIEVAPGAMLYQSLSNDLKESDEPLIKYGEIQSFEKCRSLLKILAK